MTSPALIYDGERWRTVAPAVTRPVPFPVALVLFLPALVAFVALALVMELLGEELVEKGTPPPWGSDGNRPEWAKGD